MPINHAKEASIDNKFGITDLNADHKITKMLGYELVEEKILPAGTTSCTFSNLDGDTDEEYLLEDIWNFLRHFPVMEKTSNNPSSLKGY